MKTDILIVGAGFAGASTAFHLSSSFEGSILLIDKEKLPGFHASGRNASLVLQSTEIPEVRRLIVSSRRSYTQYCSSVGYKQCGSLLLGSRAQLEKERDPEWIESQYKEPAEVCREIPPLRGHDFEAALWTPSDGVMDIAALLHFYLERARDRGTKLQLDCEIKKIDRPKQNFQIDTSQGMIEATCVIDAAGAWASQVAEMAGASEPPLRSLKRHLFILGGIASPETDWPFVWDLQHNFYFRPESGDILFSLCDEEASHSFEPTISTEISEFLAELIWDQLPAMREAVQRKIWSCFRTKTPDGRFVIGWDPMLENFFWVAGLGGHGMGGSWEIGRLAADKVLRRTESGADAFDPARFAAQKINFQSLAPSP